MKYGLIFFILMLTQSAFALYGNKVESSSENFVVSLHNKGNSFCSGVLITPTKVLTAGHCIDAYGLEEYGTSQGLVYNPHELIVQAGTQRVAARFVDLSPKYFEGQGFDAEDLALIELSRPVTSAKPIGFLPKKDLKSKLPVTLMARQKRVQTKLMVARSYAGSVVLFLDKSAGACLGDSGGAVVAQKNGQLMLAGIIIYSGEGKCDRKTNWAYYPKARF